MMEEVSESSTYEDIDKSLQKEAVLEALSFLTEREKVALWEIVGMGKTIKEIAKRFDINPIRMGQIKAKALRKLAHPNNIYISKLRECYLGVTPREHKKELKRKEQKKKKRDIEEAKARSEALYEEYKDLYSKSEALVDAYNESKEEKDKDIISLNDRALDLSLNGGSSERLQFLIDKRDRITNELMREYNQARCAVKKANWAYTRYLAAVETKFKLLNG